MIKRKFIELADWYVRKNYSYDFVHRDLIRSEMNMRIKNAVEETNKIRDEQEEEQIRALRIQHKISEDGYLAEIEHYKKIAKDAQKMRKEVETLYYKVIERIKTISVVTAENKHEGEAIINSVSSSIGRLDRINNNILDLVTDIEENKKHDLKVLKIKDL